MKVADTGSFMTAALSPVIPVPRLLGSRKKDDVIPVWNGFVCIASYDGLKIKKVENISSLLFWYL
ncbi:hypothetical protein [Wolbachia pipientis]|uniref:hypothetical protein n=1 Tax=Wolbachia pipientis TaxID=955 RepID=UPI001C70AFDE|nr:hypothetical protein [Wolbachia pipientis]